MKPWFFAAGIETLITLVVLVALSALSSWLKRRQGGSGEELPAPPPIPRRVPPGSAPPPPSQPKASSWEEELRRLLEGESTQAPSAPPPVVVYEQAPQPPPLLPPARPVVARRAPMPQEAVEQNRGLVVDMPDFDESAAAHSRVETMDNRVEERLRQGSAFAVTAAAFDQARQLHALTTERMRRVTEETPALVSTRKPGRRGGEAGRVVALLRNPDTIRSALVASVILGPPKALEG